METLEEIGQGESTTFVLPQELTSLLGRYGKHLTGGDVGSDTALESLAFDDETREMLGIDSIEELAAGDGDVDLDLEMESADIESGELEEEIE
jgi:hypothetical protein